MARVHLLLALAWAVLLLPTLLWWKDSILWVSLMSWYAIVVGHLSSYHAAHAAHAEQVLDQDIQKLDHGGQGDAE